MTPRRLVLRLTLRLPSPTALTFLAGLFAGAGINMLTSAATGESGATKAVVLDAIAWVAAAAFLTTAAHQLEMAEREAGFLVVDKDLTAVEKRSERDNIFDKVAVVTSVLVGLTVVSILAAVLLLPGK